MLRSNYSVLIDTDCGINDFRAISILINRPEIDVRGITITDGNIPPDIGYLKVSSLLKSAGKDSLPVGVGNKANHSDYPELREFTRSLTWGEKQHVPQDPVSSSHLLSKLLNRNPAKTTILCLGPLANMAELIESRPDLLPMIDRIIWYNNNFEEGTGFNYTFDTIAAGKVINSGLRVDVISNLNDPEAIFDMSILSDHKNITTPLSTLLKRFYDTNVIPAERFRQQLMLKDELVVLYLTNPELFSMNTLPGNRRIRVNTGINLPALKDASFDMITGNYSNERHIAFNAFPRDRKMFNYDVRQIMDSTIARHGLDEWKASVITNELHGHLGIYSIIGVKMGIRAREIFGVGADALKVRSFAGNNQPYSCLNDGLQVSTGATLGMNLISVTGDENPLIVSEFTLKDKTVRIGLKKEYLEKIESDIMEGIVKFGLMDDGYWKLVRQSALKYWMEWERGEIFEVEMLLP